MRRRYLLTIALTLLAEVVQGAGTTNCPENGAGSQYYQILGFDDDSSSGPVTVARRLVEWDDEVRPHAVSFER